MLQVSQMIGLSESLGFLDAPVDTLGCCTVTVGASGLVILGIGCTGGLGVAACTRGTDG